mgnify:CR=1 FL=1
MKKTNQTHKTAKKEVFLALPIVSTEKEKKTKKKKDSDDESILSDAEFLKILIKVKNGNFSQRFPTDQNGTKRSICDTLNEIIEDNETVISENNIAIEQKKREIQELEKDNANRETVIKNTEDKVEAELKRIADLIAFVGGEK